MEEGLFAGQLAIGDVTYGGLQRVFLEEVDGKLQGALYRMTQGLEAGVNEVAVGPDGDLYLGGIGYDGNWNQPGKLRYGLQKLRANDTVTMDILKTEITETGFKLTYTKPLSEETRQDLASKYQAAAVALQRHRGLRRSEARPRDACRSTGATVSADGKTVELDRARRQARSRDPPALGAAVQRRGRRAAVEHRGLVHGQRRPGLPGPGRSRLLRGRGGVGVRRRGHQHRPQQVLRVGLRRQHDHAGLRRHLHGQRRAGRSAARAHPLRQRPEPERQDEGRLAARQRHGGRTARRCPAPPTGRRGRSRRASSTSRRARNTITLRYDAGDDGWVNVDLLKVGAERDICTPAGRRARATPACSTARSTASPAGARPAPGRSPARRTAR